MNKVILPKQKDNVLSAKVDKVEDLGNYKLLTAKAGNLTIKSKINRETEVPSDSISSVSYTHLTLPTTPYV